MIRENIICSSNGELWMATSESISKVDIESGVESIQIDPDVVDFQINCDHTYAFIQTIDYLYIVPLEYPDSFFNIPINDEYIPKMTRWSPIIPNSLYILQKNGNFMLFDTEKNTKVNAIQVSSPISFSFSMPSSDSFSKYGLIVLSDTRVLTFYPFFLPQSFFISDEDIEFFKSQKMETEINSEFGFNCVKLKSQKQIEITLRHSLKEALIDIVWQGEFIYVASTEGEIFMTRFEPTTAQNPIQISFAKIIQVQGFNNFVVSNNAIFIRCNDEIYELDKGKVSLCISVNGIISITDKPRYFVKNDGNLIKQSLDQVEKLESFENHPIFQRIVFIQQKGEVLKRKEEEIKQRENHLLKKLIELEEFSTKFQNLSKRANDVVENIFETPIAQVTRTKLKNLNPASRIDSIKTQLGNISKILDSLEKEKNQINEIKQHLGVIENYTRVISIIKDPSP